MTDEFKEQTENAMKAISTMILRAQAVDFRNDEKAETISDLSVIEDRIVPVIKESNRKDAWKISCSLWKTPAVAVLLKDKAFSEAFAGCQRILDTVIRGKEEGSDEA